MGRPSKLTPNVQAIIVEHLKHGGYLSTAARLARVDPGTVGDWYKRGAITDDHPDYNPRYDRKYQQFRLAVDEAEADYENAVLKAVRNQVDKDDPRLGLQVLGIRHRRWTPRRRDEVSGPDGGPIQHEVSARQMILVALGDMRERIDTVASGELVQADEAEAV